MNEYRLVVCEKPSVARSIAAVLGAGRRGDGFLSGGGYLVSWCFGHLAELSDADAYDEKYGKSSVLLPLSKPSLITSAIFAFYWSWQEFLGPLIYLSKPRLYPVSIALKMFSDPSTQTNWSGLFAMTTLSIVPVLLVFMFFQKYLVEGVATTGLKG